MNEHMSDMDDFIFDDNDGEMIKRILREHNRPLKETVNNTEPKDIGDRVVVLDYSSLTHTNGLELTIGELDLLLNTSEYCIVIDAKNNFKFSGFVQDLTIVNPETKMQYRIASRHLRIYRRF